jgi:hypothetical protein
MTKDDETLHQNRLETARCILVAMLNNPEYWIEEYSTSRNRLGTENPAEFISKIAVMFSDALISELEK